VRFTSKLWVTGCLSISIFYALFTRSAARSLCHVKSYRSLTHNFPPHSSKCRSQIYEASIQCAHLHYTAGDNEFSPDVFFCVCHAMQIARDHLRVNLWTSRKLEEFLAREQSVMGAGIARCRRRSLASWVALHSRVQKPTRHSLGETAGWLESLINKWLEWSRVIHLAERCIMMQGAMQIKVKFHIQSNVRAVLVASSFFPFNYSYPSSTKHNKWNRKWQTAAALCIQRHWMVPLSVVVMVENMIDGARGYS
jgi:hypothetical protein